MSRFIESLRSGARLLGPTLEQRTEIDDIPDATLKKMIWEELGFKQEHDLLTKKITAVKDPEQYLRKRKEREEQLAEALRSFVKYYARTLRAAGFSAEQTGIITHRAVQQLGEVMRYPIELEFPTDFAKKGLEDLLNKKYR